MPNDSVSVVNIPVIQFPNLCFMILENPERQYLILAIPNTANSLYFHEFVTKLIYKLRSVTLYSSQTGLDLSVDKTEANWYYFAEQKRNIYSRIQHIIYNKHLHVQNFNGNAEHNPDE